MTIARTGAKTGAEAGDALRLAQPRKTKTKLASHLRAIAGEGKLHKHWRVYFLAALVETSCVKASAVVAGISPSRAYKVRRADQTFAAQWRVALREGYEHLEMELLAYLRGAETTRKIDVTAAIRLLSLHREAAARSRALEDDRNEQEVLDSIDAMIDNMRQRAAANTALLIEAAPDPLP